jgi:SAM-dependent methyltransferase
VTPPRKVYDRAYFDRWYRDPAQAVILGDHVARRVALAVAAAEYVLERRVESVLDVGAGEGAWRAHLKRRRPAAHYAGVEPSAYAVARFGARRGLVRGTFGALGAVTTRRALARVGARPPFDLVVCSDVLHYVPARELAPGLATIARWLGGGVAFIEFFTSRDATEGDQEAFQARTPAFYARALQAAKLLHVGLHCYVGPRVEREIMAMERGWAARLRDKA